MNVKLARNRESARKSRRRKKVYIDLLEKKVDVLQAELNATVKQLEQNTTSLSQVTVQNKIVTLLFNVNKINPFKDEQLIFRQTTII